MDLITSEDLNGQSMTTYPALPGHANANKNVRLSGYYFALIFLKYDPSVCVNRKMLNMIFFLVISY